MTGNLLVIGSDSLIGKSLSEVAALEGIAVHKLSRMKPGRLSTDTVNFDLSDPEFHRWIDVTGVSHSVILAGVTSIAMCESNPLDTRLVNVVGVSRVAKALSALGISVTVISSNQVFSRYDSLPGINSPRSPACEYGRQKVELEDRLSRLEHVKIVRITKILTRDNSVIMSWRKALSKGENVTAFANISLAPLPLKLAVEALLVIATQIDQRGIFHLSPTDEMTYYEFAQFLSTHWGFDLSLIHPQNVEEDPFCGRVTGPYSALGSVSPLLGTSPISSRWVSTQVLE